jgi:hypothetical protein
VIDGDTQCFPINVVKLLALRAEQVIDPGDTTVVKRPLGVTDPDQSISVVAVDWSPVQKSREMGQKTNPKEEVAQRYTIVVQTLINDADEDRASNRHSVFSKMVRDMFYRDQVLQVALPQLSVAVGGIEEVVSDWGVRDQRQMVNHSEGSFLYLSTLDFWVETINKN